MSSTPAPPAQVENGTAMPVDDDGIRAHLQKLDKKLQLVMDVLKSEPQTGELSHSSVGEVIAG